MQLFWKEGLLPAPLGEIKRGAVLVLAWNASAWLKSVSAANGVQLTLSPDSLVTVDSKLDLLAQAVAGSKIVARIQLKLDGGAAENDLIPMSVLVVASDGQRWPFDFFLHLVDTSSACIC